MYSSKIKKSSKRRLKSTSPKKSKNRYYDYNKKKDNILALEESKKLYTKLFANPSNIVINQLKGDELKIYTNSFTPKDILVLSIILSKYFYFHSVELGSSDPNKNEEDNAKQKKKEKYLYQNENDRKNKENEKIQTTNKILSSIGKNLLKTKNLFNLSLYAFNIDKKVAENISQGISKNKSLQTLLIKNCKMNIDSYEILLKGLLTHEKIKFLDLSNNNFNDKYGNMISRIIIRQSQRRDQIIWSYGLRNEFPANNDYARGLISINLHGNKLGEKASDKICYALSSDQYLRAIDLSDNIIDNNSCKKYIYMMRKNNTLLTLDLRNNPGYVENIHSRLVMKMSKNIHILYQQYQSGVFTEEEFENLKDYIEISFFDVDIPQEIVEFYNQNLPEEEENEQETDNLQENNYIQDMENFSNNEDNKEKKNLKMQNKSNNYSNISNNNFDKSKTSAADKSLIEENLKLKQQIIELKALNLQRQLKNNISNNELNHENENKNEKETNRNIEDDYKRLVELVNELNEVMNNIEIKKNKKIEKAKNKKEKKEKEKEKKEEKKEDKKEEKKEEKIPKKDKKEEEKISLEQEKQKQKQIEKQKQKEIELEKQKQKEIEKQKQLELEKQKEIERQKKIELEKQKEKEKEKEMEKQKELEKKKKKEEKIKKEKGLKENLEDSKKPLPYEELQAEPSEENKSAENQIMDEDGNVFNFDDLTDEEKMSILHQQLILQKLQEEAEARGEQFDPQLYLAYLEQQAEEEELMQKNGSNKLNKSF